MADTTFRLIYRSRSLIPTESRKSALGQIFSAARSNNKYFVQALEGEEQAVQRLYDHIAKDDRHEDVTVVDERRLDERTFGKWSMAQVAEDGSGDIPLLMNRDKGGITRKAPEPTTADQDVVLDFMHTAAQP